MELLLLFLALLVIWFFIYDKESRYDFFSFVVTQARKLRDYILNYINR